MKKMLILPNGHGEDMVAAELIKRLIGKADVSVFPMVDEGKAFSSLDVKVLGPRKNLPGGGFSLRNLSYLAKDLLSGLAGSTIEQIKLLRSYKGQFDLVVGIGDIIPIIGASMIKAPFVFLGVNKTSYYKWFGYNYTPWEKFMLQKALKVFVRDKYTEKDLRGWGIKIPSAEYAGNPLMDCMEKITRHSPSPVVTIGFLPGTRADVKLNMEDFNKIAEEIAKTNRGEYKLMFSAATDYKNASTLIQKRSFAQVLTEADIIIGLAGTGNEQAAGLGIPVISFYGRGSQYDKKFAEAQKQLLGRALLLIREKSPIIAAAAAAWDLVRNPEERELMAKVGKERMGEPGALDKIADFILQYLYAKQSG